MKHTVIKVHLYMIETNVSYNTKHNGRSLGNPTKYKYYYLISNVHIDTSSEDYTTICIYNN